MDWTLYLGCTLDNDYISFTRKSITTAPRSAFLQAIRASPYVDLDKKKSTNDVKFLRFTDKFKNLLAMSDSAEEVALETAPTVPDVDMEENRSFDSPPPFYPVNGNLITANVQAERNRNADLVSMPVGTEPQEESPPNAKSPEHTLPPEEQSFPLNFPENYNPELDLIQSLGRNQNALNNSLMGRTPFEIHDVCSVEVNGNMVRKIQDVDPNSSPSQMRFLCTIQRSSN